MGRRKSRYSKADMAKPTMKETPYEELRSIFPKKLVELFVKFHDDGENVKAYNAYNKAAQEFLGEQAGDKIEQGKLIVRLTKATFDLVDKNGKAKKEKAVKTKRPEKSDGH